jgi:tRNA nucleotidyltransferase (CCA-adding enzyme)
MIELVRALPAAGPLLERAGEVPGLHIVGGAVRDLLLGDRPPDLDLVLDGDLAELVARLGGRLRRHDRFGTATVVLDGHSYDVARARRERYPAPGALPEVEPASLEQDLGRRDFTVNAIAVELGGPHAGELRAVPSALEDLGDRRLGVLHDASFIDDPTRMLRLARYAARLRFEIEPHTRELAQTALAGGALKTVTGPRIGNELRLLAAEPDPLSALLALDRLEIELAPGFGGLDEPPARRALELLGADGDRGVLVIAAAARGMPAAELAAWLDRLAFEAGTRELIVAAATRSEELALQLSRATTPSQIASAVAGGSPELVALAGALGGEAQAREWLRRLRQVRLEIDGEDLIAAGVPPGPGLGRGLRAALAAKLDGRATGRDEELAEALRAAR